jgi:hypothetical protein
MSQRHVTPRRSAATAWGKLGSSWHTLLRYAPRRTMALKDTDEE